MKMSEWLASLRTTNTMWLAPCVSVRTDEGYDARYPDARMARIRITCTDGSVHERVVDDGYGAPSQPMNDAALAQKFEGLVAPVMGTDRARELRGAFEALDAAADTRGLLGLLAA
jgi:2-methylcitrate dehydratase PrpD